MDFAAGQYDPQIGRFLGVDPLGDYYGQDRYSPYATMDNQPESMVDPNGLYFGPPAQLTKMTFLSSDPGSGNSATIFNNMARNSYSSMPSDFMAYGGGLWPPAIAIEMMDEQEYANYTRSINSYVINTYGSSAGVAVNQPTKEGADNGLPLLASNGDGNGFAGFNSFTLMGKQYYTILTIMVSPISCL